MSREQEIKPDRQGDKLTSSKDTDMSQDEGQEKRQRGSVQMII